MNTAMNTGVVEEVKSVRLNLLEPCVSEMVEESTCLYPMYVQSACVNFIAYSILTLIV